MNQVLYLSHFSSWFHVLIVADTNDKKWESDKAAGSYGIYGKSIGKLCKYFQCVYYSIILYNRFSKERKMMRTTEKMINKLLREISRGLNVS